jgi:hypothetical protein
MTAPRARLYDAFTEADLGRCDPLVVPARGDRMTLATGRVYEVARVDHRLADGEVDVHLTDLEAQEDLRRYGYLAGNPVRSDEEEAELPVLVAKLAAWGMEPGFDPVPREALPVYDDAGRQQVDARGFPKRGPAP